MLVGAAVFGTFVSVRSSAPSAPDEPSGAGERTSYAVGFSAGAGLRGVVPVSVDDFRQGLLDGLGGDTTQTRVLSRSEFFSAIRQLMKRLSEAELAAVAARIDQEQDH